MISERFAGPIRRGVIVLSELRAGGMERVVFHLASHLPHYGVEPLVICLEQEGPLAAELKIAGVPVVALHSARCYDVPTLLRLAQLICQFKPDFINVHDYSSLPYVAMASFVRPTCPVVFTGHGLLYAGFERLQRRCRLSAYRVRALTAVSRQVRDRHIDYLNWRGTTHVVPNGVPEICRSFEARRELRGELGIGAKDFVFLAVGNPRPEKAFEDLIEAASIVRTMHCSRRFWVLIAGKLTESDYCTALRRTAMASGISELRLLGYRTDVERLYSVADAFVLPSHSEGLPMVLLEAMMAELPIIGTRVGGVPDAATPDGSILVDPGFPQQVADAMLQLLLAGRMRLEHMGRAARLRAISQFGIRRMVERYLNVYRTALKKPVGGNGK